MRHLAIPQVCHLAEPQYLTVWNFCFYIYNNIDIDYGIKDWFITHGFDFQPNFDITNSWLSLLNDTQKVPLHPLARVEPGAFGPLAHQKEEEEGKLHFFSFNYWIYFNSLPNLQNRVMSLPLCIENIQITHHRLIFD